MQNDSTATQNLSGDIRFLIACCQTEQSEDDIDFIISSIRHPTFNIQHLMTLASGHGIFPLVYKTIKELSTSHYLLEQLLADLKSAYSQVARRNMLMSAELIRIMKLLEENNIEALAFKGPTLSQMAYGDITLRQYGDLDILIKPNDFIAVHQLLTHKMYDTKYNYNNAVDKVLELIPDHMFISSGSQIPIEIHNKLFASNFPIQVSDNIFWDNSTTITINNKAIPTFTNEYLLFYLCLHGGKHLFSRISWILDIAMLIKNTRKDFDLKLFKEIADQHHLQTMISVGLHLAMILFQTKIPEHILQNFNTDKRSLKIVNTIIESITEDPIDSERFTLTHLRMFDSWSEKMRYSIYLFKPSVLDYQIFDKKYRSDSLYYIIRPFHIFYRVVSKKF